MSRFRTLWRFSWRERVLLLEAFTAIPLVRVLVLLLGVQRVERLLSRRTRWAAARDRHDEDASKRAVAVAAIVGIAARRLSKNHTCLHRSLALWWILRRRQLDARLQMGVRKIETGGFEAHAWVDYRGVVLNDDPLVSTRYTRLSIPAAPGGQWAT